MPMCNTYHSNWDAFFHASESDSTRINIYLNINMKTMKPIEIKIPIKTFVVG